MRPRERVILALGFLVFLVATAYLFRDVLHEDILGGGPCRCAPDEIVHHLERDGTVFCAPIVNPSQFYQCERGEEVRKYWPGLDKGGLDGSGR